MVSRSRVIIWRVYIYGLAPGGGVSPPSSIWGGGVSPWHPPTSGETSGWGQLTRAQPGRRGVCGDIFSTRLSC